MAACGSAQVREQGMAGGNCGMFRGADQNHSICNSSKGLRSSRQATASIDQDPVNHSAVAEFDHDLGEQFVCGRADQPGFIHACCMRASQQADSLRAFYQGFLRSDSA